jgi:uridylate kinase
MRRDPVYKRVLLKLSGESLAGAAKSGISPEIISYFVQEVKKVYALGVEIGIVIGGGNIFRGLSKAAEKMDRVSADHMGMLATVINSLALKDALLSSGIPAQVLTAVKMDEFAKHYVRDDALAHIQSHNIVILAAGTGNPFFTTDTAAVLRAVELNADVVLKGTRVDGVYSADPEEDATAVRYETLTYMDVVSKGLKVMDSTAITLAMDNDLPVIVFNFDKADNFKNVILGESIGTKVQR